MASECPGTPPFCCCCGPGQGPGGAGPRCWGPLKCSRQPPALGRIQGPLGAQLPTLRPGHPCPSPASLGEASSCLTLLTPSTHAFPAPPLRSPHLIADKAQTPPPSARTWLVATTNACPNQGLVEARARPSVGEGDLWVPGQQLPPLCLGVITFPLILPRMQGGGRATVSAIFT